MKISKPVRKHFLLRIIFFNSIILLVCGFTFLTIGIWLEVQGVEFLWHALNPKTFCYVCGAYLTITAAFAFAGTILTNRKLLRLYAVSLCACLVMILISLALYISFQSDVDAALKNEMFVLANEDITTWDKFQSTLGCCGIDGPEDWQDVKPESCCLGQCYEGNMFPEGCYVIVHQWMDSNYLLLGVTIGVMCILIILNTVCAITVDYDFHAYISYGNGVVR